MRLQQSGLSGFGYSPSASTAASGNNSGGASQATARQVLLGSVWSALGLSGPTGGVQDIASALSSALSAGLASGQDLAPQLTQTVDTALDQVAQQLEAKGVSPHHVERLVAKFRQDLADALNSAAASAANGGGSSSVAASATPTGVGASQGASRSSGTSVTAGVSSTPSTNTAGVGNSLASSFTEFAAVSESETLTIQTADGAQVTISFGAQGAELSGWQTQADGSTSAAAALFAGENMQVQVSGNLSSADLTAINNVVSQVDSLATQFFSGDVQDAFAAAASIGADPSEIAGFSLQMSYSTTLYQQVGAATDPTASNTTPPVVTTPATGQSTASDTTNATTAPAASNAASATTATATTPAAGSSNGTTTGQTTTSTPATTTTPQQTIADFLQNVLAKLGGATNGSGGTVSASWAIQLLAVALPVYAQSQATTGTQAGAQSTSSTSSGTGNSAPAVTQVALTTPIQAARLAAATLVQLVN